MGGSLLRTPPSSYTRGSRAIEQEKSLAWTEYVCRYTGSQSGIPALCCWVLREHATVAATYT